MTICFKDAHTQVAVIFTDDHHKFNIIILASAYFSYQRTRKCQIGWYVSRLLTFSQFTSLASNITIEAEVCR